MAVKSVCPTCGRIGCEAHKRKPWQERTPRRTRTVSGWQQQKRARFVMLRDEAVCHICKLGGATEVDHVVALSEGGADDVSNLAPAHHDCHARKSAAEAQRGRARALSTKGVGTVPRSHHTDGTGLSARGEFPKDAA